MVKKMSIATMALSAFVSFYLYWSYVVRVDHLILSHEWHSNIVSVLPENDTLAQMGIVRRVNVLANTKFLSNGTYIRDSRIFLRTAGGFDERPIRFSETGKWELADNYMLISPTEFRDLMPAETLYLSEEEITLVKEFYKVHAKQSQKIDILDGHTLLWTDLGNRSKLFFAY